MPARACAVQGALAGVNRNLLQGGGRGGGGNTQGSQQRATNTLRSEIATADAIARAVNSGAVLGYNRMAAGVGVNTVFANTQGNKAVSVDTRAHYPAELNGTLLMLHHSVIAAWTACCICIDRSTCSFSTWIQCTWAACVTS